MHLEVSHSYFIQRTVSTRLLHLDHLLEEESYGSVTNPSLQKANAAVPRNRIPNMLAFLIGFVGVTTYCIFLALGKYEIYAYPLLISASLCTLLSASTSVERRQIDSSLSDSATNMCMHLLRSSRARAGDANIQRLSIVFILIPCSVYVTTLVIHHLKDAQNSKTHANLANDFGKLSVMAMSYFLVPVSRHSILLKCLRINPSHAVQLHIFAAYIALFGGLMHGLYWIWIWIFVKNETMATILPLGKCWSWDEDGDCHGRFVNLFGIFAGTCFVLLGLTSMRWVRRNHYRVFYVCHGVFSVCLLFGLVMHYNKMILYIAPGFLYYMASSMPVWIQALQSWMQGGTIISNVAHIPDSGGCVEISFRVDPATHVDDSCGNYVRICVPEVSAVWHPFTVFTKSDGSGDLGMLFRIYGPFTAELSNRLLPSSSGNRYPKILVDGCYGGPDRLSQALGHETVVIIAGGVGIVSYISLLSLLSSILSGDSVGCGKPDVSRTKRILVHWVCRDEGLIKHIMDNYCNSCFETIRSVEVQFVVHHTRKSQLNSMLCSRSQDLEDLVAPSTSTCSPEKWTDHETSEQGKPFVPAAFSSGGTTGVRNFLPTATFSLISFLGLWIAQYFYENVQQKRIVHTRSYAVLAIIALSICVSILGLIGMKKDSEVTATTFAKLNGVVQDDVSNASTDALSDDTEIEAQECHLHLVEHNEGRPNVSDLIEGIIEANDDLGIFMCGPTVLHLSVRKAIEQQTLRRSQKTAIYEEVFEL